MPKHVQKCQPCCPCDFFSAPKNVVRQCDGTSKSRIFSLLDFFWGVNDVSIIVWLKMFQGFSWGHSCSPNKISEGLWRWEVLARQVVRNQGIERSPFNTLVSPQRNIWGLSRSTEVANCQGQNCREPESANWQVKVKRCQECQLKVGKSYPNWDVTLWCNSM